MPRGVDVDKLIKMLIANAAAEFASTYLLLHEQAACPLLNGIEALKAVVRLRSVAEDANTNSIYRARLDSSSGLTVSPP